MNSTIFIILGIVALLSAYCLYRVIISSDEEMANIMRPRIEEDQP
jgi:hypothetical protein